MPIRVLHLSTYDASGGAARAAYTLHRAMANSGIDSRMMVAQKRSNDPTVKQASQTRHRITRQLDRRLWNLQRSSVRTWRSPARFASLRADALNRSDADIVNLHWVTDGFLSVEEIARIEKPLVWSMYDMWPFSGTEHYGTDATDARWREGYSQANRPIHESGVDLDRWTYKRKMHRWGERQPIHLVPASSWLHTATGQSALMGRWPITQVPHAVDTDIFAPMDKLLARRTLGIPDRPTVTFLASAGIDDERKGWDLLERALCLVRGQQPDLQALVVGPIPNESRRRQAERSAQVALHWFGNTTDSAELRLMYSAGDVTAVPSRRDNMPLTAMEAQACGRPVAGFAVGGLEDIVSPGLTGWLAQPEDTEGLGSALAGALGRVDFELAARNRALSMWSFEPVVAAYSEVYKLLLG